MSSDGIRESRNGGDLCYESQTVTTKQDNEWYIIWERGEKETHVGVQADGKYPCELEEWR